MKVLNRLLLISGFLYISLNAHDVEITNRDRKHSVRQVVDSVAKIPQKEISEVDNFQHMFEDASVSGRVVSMYSYYNNDEKGVDDIYATAVGGYLKYELADYEGFNAAAAFVTAHDINGLTGEDSKQNIELASSDGTYTELSEMYINYKYKDFNFRAGRQVLDTPLADSDDIRIVANTFEAYVATYKYDNFSFMAGKLLKWQGSDTGLDENEPWQKTGENGTYFGGVVYEDSLVDIHTWYYNMTELTNSAYIDMSFHKNITKDLFFHTGLQYLNQSELNNSEVESKIYGAFVEVVFSQLGLNLAYNKSEKQSNKDSFSGFGGGALFTNMDTMILNNITRDRDASAIVGALTYEINEIGLLYAYGDFNGDRDSLGVKEHIVEQNFGLEYKVNDDFTFASIVTISEDKENSTQTSYDYDNFRVLIAYSF